MDSTSKITYGGNFAKPIETASSGPNGSQTKYLGGEVPKWIPRVETSEKDASSEAATK